VSDDGYESAGEQLPHVNRSHYDGAFAVAQIKEINVTLRGIEAELQALQQHNKAVLIGPVLVRKAQALSALIQARFLRLALGTADTEGLTRSYLGKLRQQNTEVWPLVQEALTAHRREIARLKRELNTETSSLKQEREQIRVDTERLEDHWALFYKEKNASLIKQRAEDPDYNTDDNNDADTRSDYAYFFGRAEEASSFCDSDGNYCPELEAAYDRKEQIRAQFEIEANAYTSSNCSPPRERQHRDTTILTRSPCSLGPGWVRYRNTDGASQGSDEKYERAEATSDDRKNQHARAVWLDWT
jgi:hypothetical protein